MFFFNNSPKRQEALLKVIKDNLPNERHTELLDVCRTRWIERVKGLGHFIDMYPAVIATLKNMDQNNDKNWNRDTSSDASTLLESIRKFEFIVTLIITSNILNYTIETIRKLQRKEMDIVKGYAEIDAILSTVAATRKSFSKSTRTGTHGQ